MEVNEDGMGGEYCAKSYLIEALQSNQGSLHSHNQAHAQTSAKASTPPNQNRDEREPEGGREPCLPSPPSSPLLLPTPPAISTAPSSPPAEHHHHHRSSSLSSSIFIHWLGSKTEEIWWGIARYPMPLDQYQKKEPDTCKAGANQEVQHYLAPATNMLAPATHALTAKQKARHCLAPATPMLSPDTSPERKNSKSRATSRPLPMHLAPASRSRSILLGFVTLALLPLIKLYFFGV